MSALVERAVGLAPTTQARPAAPSGMTVSGGGACFPLTATSDGVLLEQAWSCLQRVQAEGGDRLLVASRAPASRPSVD